MKFAGLKLRATFFVLLFLAMTNSWAGAARPTSTSALNDVVAEVGIENDLKQLLGASYEIFKRNFEEAANPVRLKDGGVFIDGWRSGNANKYAAALVYYPDGKIYAAYYNSIEGQIIYFSQNDSRIHPAIQIWARRFSPQFKAISQTSESKHIISTQVLDAPSPEDQEEMRKVAASIWGQSLASGWDMNTDVGDILGTVTKEIMDCSEAYNLVPKPVGWRPGWGYVAKTALQIVSYIVGVSQDRRYKICVDTAALNWRSAIEMASAGI